ncbi:serine hydrolase [Nesterenkonia sp. E16_10]|nr:serine hydrolase [Nesterenkonia sp. E16_10]MBO0595216.1 serine hydrolase [Nesterenkonia sp. E16_10]
MTACSPAVFHPAPAHETAGQAEQTQQTEQPEPTKHADQHGEDTEDAAPLPALAAEVQSARESQREAAAEGASALEAAHQQHQAELAAEEARLAAEQAEAEAEIERQRLQDQAAQEESQDQDGSSEEPEDDAEAEAPTDGSTPAEPAPDDTEEADTAEEDAGEEGSSPSTPSAEEPSPDESEPVRPEAPTDAPSFTGDLDDYLEQLAAHYPGDISISVAELGGEGRTGSTAGGESRVSASTYKVFVAYGILDRVESGEMDWDDPIDGGRDRATCFADMISVSDNPCADVFREELGWEALRDIAAETGGPATDFIPAYARTSVNDLTAFMTRLESGALGISEASRSRLLGALESNIFREGIAAGSTGAVLNKVGFIDGYFNDTAIVRHPQGRYVMSIMSEGSDWNAIASITRDIEAALY